MLNPLRSDGRPRLLVSVRNPEEAQDALAGGADLIDIKEPSRGPLGAADPETIAAIVRAVEGRAPVSAALGELVELVERRGLDSPRLPEISYFKIGLSKCADLPLWTDRWHDIAVKLGSSARPVAVVYADWQAAAAPEPEMILAAGIAAGCPALLVDTWDKSSGALLDHWPAASLRTFIDQVRSHDIALVLAGSITRSALATATRLQPDVVAVRGAACEGGREGRISRRRVAALRHAIEEE